MLDCNLQVLFNTLPPYSQLLFSEPSNAPLLWDFHEPSHFSKTETNGLTIFWALSSDQKPEILT